MNKFVITTDYTADLTEQFYQESGIERVLLPFNIGNAEYDIKNSALSYTDFYNKMRSGAVVTTSQVSQYDATQIFSKHLEKGLDILHLCFSSGVSSSFDNFAQTVKDLKVKYPNNRVVVIDTLCGAGALGIMVDKAYKMQQGGKTLDEIATWIEKNKLRFQHFFVVDDLASLRRGGRLSGLEALVGTILGIKPVLALNHAGKILPIAKVRGQKKAYAEMERLTLDQINVEENEYIIVGHGDNLEYAKMVGEPIAKATGLPIVYNYINYLIGAHAGPNVVAVFFLGKTRKNG